MQNQVIYQNLLRTRYGKQVNYGQAGTSCLLNLTRSRAVALNFCSKNDLGSIWPGGLPIPNKKSEWLSYWMKKSNKIHNTGFQANQFVAVQTLCFPENDRLHSSAY